MDPNKINQIFSFLQDEQNGAAMYHTLAQLEKDKRLAQVYQRMAEVEEKHAAAWLKRLSEANVSPPPQKLTWRTRTLIWAARRFGVGAVLPSLATFEQINRNRHHRWNGKPVDAAETCPGRGEYHRRKRAPKSPAIFRPRGSS